MPIFYYTNEDGVYSGFETFTEDVETPKGAILVPPEFQDGYKPLWTGSAWSQIEDHRGKIGYVDGKYKRITELGPYPEGWSTTAPERPQEEPRGYPFQLKRQLEELDMKSIRALRELATGRNVEADQARLAELESQAEDLRAQLAEAGS
jgi:hypothetical protein